MMTSVLDRKKPTNKDILREFLEKRLNDVQENPELLVTDRWNQSTVWYLINPILQSTPGLKVAKRRNVVSEIKEVCEEMGYRRHELGIIAAVRAQLSFRGQTRGIGFDDIDQLAEVGTDVIIIEKENIVEFLEPFAEEYGIALVFTRGFATEYALELAEKTDANIAILTDFDVSGLVIAKQIEDTGKDNLHWLGINPEMIKGVGLRLEDVHEGYGIDEKTAKPKKAGSSHYKNLKTRAVLTADPFLKEWLPWLLYKRVEIDAVRAKVGSRKLWDYIFKRLDFEFDTRDYNRSIDVPRFVLPEIYDQFVRFLIDRVADNQRSRRQEIVEELSFTTGFLKVKNKEQEIYQDLLDVLNSMEETNNQTPEQILRDVVSEFFNLDHNRYDE